MSRNRMFASVSLLIALSSLTGSARADNILFEDHFNTDGPLSPEWTTISASQWVEGGQMNARWDGNGDSLASIAVVHDGDSTWTDYRFSATVDPAGGYAYLNFRGSESKLYGGPGLHMVGYELIFDANQPNPEVILAHIDGNMVGYNLAKVPYDGLTIGVGNLVDVLCVGPRIQVSVNGTQIIDVVDSNPILFGGIGIQSVFAGRLARFDNVVVTDISVPVPASWATGLVGLAAVMIVGRKRIAAR